MPMFTLTNVKGGKMGVKKRLKISQWSLWMISSNLVFPIFRWLTFPWLTIVSVNVGIATRASTWSSTTRWCAPATTAGAKTAVKGTLGVPWWQKLRGVGPWLELYRPDILVQNGVNPVSTIGSPKPQIGYLIQSTIKINTQNHTRCDKSQKNQDSKKPGYFPSHLKSTYSKSSMFFIMCESICWLLSKPGPQKGYLRSKIFMHIKQPPSKNLLLYLWMTFDCAEQLWLKGKILFSFFYWFC